MSPAAVASSEPVETLLFVDVDGVLNVGVRDDSAGHPLELSETNMSNAKKMWASRKGRQDRSCIERLVATCDRRLGHCEEASTYASFVANPSTGVSDVLVARLALLILSLGNSGLVVLTSTWRKPKYAKRVAKLEEAISFHMGEPFAFDAKTSLCEDDTPGGRLQGIGNFIFDYCCVRDPSATDLRVLVLEDFYLSPIGDWAGCGSEMESVEDVEHYLEGRATAGVNVSARVVHTYDSCVTASGLPVQIGAGLTLEHFCRAYTFLGGHCAHCEKELSALSAQWLENEPKSIQLSPGYDDEGSANPAFASLVAQLPVLLKQPLGQPLVMPSNCGYGKVWDQPSIATDLNYMEIFGTCGSNACGQ